MEHNTGIIHNIGVNHTSCTCGVVLCINYLALCVDVRTANKHTYDTGISGASLTSMAFANAFPGGDFIVTIGLCLFAFTTMIGWSFYGERCAVFLLGTRAILPFRLAWVVAIPIGTVIELEMVWLIADTLNAFMAIPNLIALLLLSPLVFKISKEYFVDKEAGDVQPNE